MIAAWADILINLVAAIGLSILAYQLLGKDNRTLIEKHIGHVVIAAGVLVSFRAFFWIDSLKWLEAVSLFAAILIPMLILIATEQLLRRHAHFCLKILAAGWVLSGFLMMIAGRPEPLFTYANAAMQFFIPAISIIWILSRDRQQYTDAENRNFMSFIFALSFIMLLSFTDFPTLIILPVRLGAVGMLIVCYILVFAYDRKFSPLRAWFELVAISSITCVFYLLTRLVLESAQVIDLIRLSVLLFCLLLLTVIIVRVCGRRFEFQEFSNETISKARTDKIEHFLEDTLMSRVSTEAHLLNAESLRDYNLDLMAQLFEDKTVITQRSLEDLQTNSPSLVIEQIKDLMHRYKATHAIFISGAAPQILLSAAPLMNDAHEQDAYFNVVAKMAHLINQKPH